MQQATRQVRPFAHPFLRSGEKVPALAWNQLHPHLDGYDQ